MVRFGIVQPGFCVDGAREMVVQVAALGHASQKSTQRERAGGARLLHVGGGLLLRCAGLRGRCRKHCEENGNQQSKLPWRAARA